MALGQNKVDRPDFQRAVLNNVISRANRARRNAVSANANEDISNRELQCFEKFLLLRETEHFVVVISLNKTLQLKFHNTLHNLNTLKTL